MSTNTLITLMEHGFRIKLDDKGEQVLEVNVTASSRMPQRILDADIGKEDIFTSSNEHGEVWAKVDRRNALMYDITCIEPADQDRVRITARTIIEIAPMWHKENQNGTS